MSTIWLKIYDFGGNFSVGEDHVGVRGCARERGEQRAGANKRYAVALRDIGKVGVPVKDEIATEFLRAEFERSQIAFDVIFVAVREQNLEVADLHDFFVVEAVRIAIAFDRIEIFVEQQITERCYAVTQKEDVIVLLRHAQKPRRKR